MNIIQQSFLSEIEKIGFAAGVARQFGKEIMKNKLMIGSFGALNHLEQTAGQPIGDTQQNAGSLTRNVGTEAASWGAYGLGEHYAKKGLKKISPSYARSVKNLEKSKEYLKLKRKANPGLWARTKAKVTGKPAPKLTNYQNVKMRAYKKYYGSTGKKFGKGFFRRLGRGAKVGIPSQVAGIAAGMAMDWATSKIFKPSKRKGTSFKGYPSTNQMYQGGQ